MRYTHAALACLLAACTHVAHGNSFDCSACQGVKADANGLIKCRCEIEVTSLDVDRKGFIEISATECSETVTVSGNFDGEEVAPQDVTNDGIKLESLSFCDGDLVLTLEDLFYSQSGMHFCPHLKVCDVLTINNDKDWCVTVTEGNPCLSHSTCGECVADHPDGECVWCNRTYTCVRKNPSSGEDICGICGAGQVIDKTRAGSCPAGTSKDLRVTTANECRALNDINECVLESCEWSSTDGCRPQDSDGVAAEGNTFDCSNCEGIRAAPDGTLRCSCRVSVDILGVQQTGNITLTASECSDSVTVGGWWESDRIEPQELTNDGVVLEEIALCDGDLRLTVHDLFFSESGIHMCPELKVCDLVTVNNDKDWCVTIRESNSCMSHDNCGDCLNHKTDEECVWCNRTFTCLRKDPADDTKDTCRMCDNDLILKRDEAQCPTGTGRSLGLQSDDACRDLADFTDCILRNCEWRDSDCIPLVDEGTTVEVDGVEGALPDVGMPSGGRRPAPPPGGSGGAPPATLVPPGTNLGIPEVGSAKFEETNNKKQQRYGEVLLLMLLLCLAAMACMGYRVKRHIETHNQRQDTKVTPSEVMSEPSRDLRDVHYDDEVADSPLPRHNSMRSVKSTQPYGV